MGMALSLPMEMRADVSVQTLKAIHGNIDVSQDHPIIKLSMYHRSNLQKSGENEWVCTFIHKRSKVQQSLLKKAVLKIVYFYVI